MLNFFSPKRTDPTIERLYGAIVAQARDPAFYSTYRVPDTLDGRFDMLILHVALFFRRTKAEVDEVRILGQAVFDRFCVDMDSSLREIGFGDTGVPRQMRRMGEAFYGRAAAYEAALADGDDDKLSGALARNVYGAQASELVSAGALAAYVRRAVAALAAQDGQAFLGGTVSFPEPGPDPMRTAADQ